MRKRLANAKTRSATGLDYVMNNINLNTPFGRKRIKEKSPFFPGEENLLKREFEKLASVRSFVEEEPAKTDALMRIFMETKDITFTVARSAKDALSVVELFEIKSMLLKIAGISGILKESRVGIPGDYLLIDLMPLLLKLDPGNDGMDTFYIYDGFSAKLAEARKRKRDIEISVRREQKKQKEAIRAKYGIELTPKFEYMTSKANTEQITAAREIAELIQIDEDYVSVTFTLKGTEETDRLLKETDALLQVIEKEELKVRETLSREIALYEKELLENCAKIGELDIAICKAVYAIKHDCVIPEISDGHVIEIEDGRFLQVEDMLASKNKAYCPVSISLADGVTCITGANMGGKTISLKLAGLVALLTQNAFFVPCKKAAVGLSGNIRILIGDNQSLERGLSSFGSEMEELKEILDNGSDRALLLIDEIASGTNPAEGSALTKGLVAYLKDKPYISLLTTHFDNAATDKAVRNLQVVGLANADFSKLYKELRYADRRERINLISGYMDYRLYEVTRDKKVPRDALNIAGMLGIYTEIIENAKKYLEE